MYEPAQPSACRGAAANAGRRSCGVLDVTGKVWLRWPLSEEMRVQLRTATTRDVASIVQLRAAVANRLTADYGEGPWSRASTDKGVLFDMRSSKVLVARDARKVIATLRLTTKKPWAIDQSYFAASRQPVYLLSMAVLPDLQRQGIGKQCLEDVRVICEHWPADAIRLDAYDAPAGAGAFYAKCGFKDVGRASYRGVPLAYYELLLKSGHHVRNAQPASGNRRPAVPLSVL